MGETDDLLKFLKRREYKAQVDRLLQTKGYADPLDDDFGLNQWTRRLAHLSVDQKDTPFVSFLVIPAPFLEAHPQIDSPQFHTWLMEYKWRQVSGMHSPPEFHKVYGCSDGLLMPDWENNSNKQFLKGYLIIQHNGAIDFCLGADVFYLHHDVTIFRLIHIVGRLWQFLTFVQDLHREISINSVDEYNIIVNFRGTENSLMGDVAKGWPEPHLTIDRPIRNRCIDKHFQVSKRIHAPVSAEEIEGIIHWFATRTDNAWGYLEPRCYVHTRHSEARPFGTR